jgi:hypothetical protein
MPSQLSKLLTIISVLALHPHWLPRNAQEQVQLLRQVHQVGFPVY